MENLTILSAVHENCFVIIFLIKILNKQQQYIFRIKNKVISIKKLIKIINVGFSLDILCLVAIIQ